VGAGLAGLRCAQVLTSHGVDVIVVERSAHVGGRLRSFTVDGFIVDQGFLLVNPSYPELVATGILLDLDLRPFAPAVEFRQGGRRRVLADPRRHPFVAVAALRTVSPTQFVRLGALLARATWMPARRLTAGSDSTTLEGLRQAGLDRHTIDTVMRPFLRGILLEDDLSSSWLFSQLLLKSFGRGRPSTHPEGIEAVARALAHRSRSEVRLNSIVNRVSPHAVEVDGISVAACAVVVATDAFDASKLVSAPDVAWHRQLCWWWSAPQVKGGARMRIDLDDPLTTSALDLAAVAPERAPLGRSLIATPTISGTRSDVDRARASVARLYDLETKDVELITMTEVAHALPHVDPPFVSVQENYIDGVVLAGDYLTSSSIQGALVSGRRAATAVLRQLDRA
jgi:phytoene dehydrogenase-like protein